MSIQARLLLAEDYDLYQHDIPTLVVCKSGLKYQWITDGVDKFLDGATSIVIDGTKKKRTKLYDEIKTSGKCYDYVIVGYETVREDVDILQQLNIGLAIFDESHKIRNRTTKLNKAISKLDIKYSFFLTGSPINGEPDGIFGLSKVGNKKFLGTWKNFEQEYITYVRGRFGFDTFYKNLDKLKEKVDEVSLRRTSCEIDMDMPDMVVQNISIEMTKEQRDIDDAILESLQELSNKLEAVPKIEDAEERRQVKENLEGAIKGMVNLRLGASDSPELFLLSKSPAVRNKYGAMVKTKKSAKLEYLKEHVKDIIDSGNKVVIFSRFKTMVDIIERELKALKITDIVTFTGSDDAKTKEECRIKFKTDPNCGVFACTNAAAEGLNLQESRYLINFDLDWDIGINDQRNKRIRRLDSTFKSVFVYNYICKDSADELVVRANEEKQDMFDFLIQNNAEQSRQLKEIMNR